MVRQKPAKLPFPSSNLGATLVLSSLLYGFSVLYIVSTPIGNLQDITFRAIETLKTCDYILAEDTRQSIKILNHYAIEKRLVSFHEFNEVLKEDTVIQDLLDGKTIALVSDAGTPLIADPGQKLVKRCIKEGIKVENMPGPCAVICALSVSGLETIPFQFIGFPPRKKGELTTFLKKILDYPGTSIAYESPERIAKTIGSIAALDGTRELVIARELTKKFETLYRGSATSLHPIFSEMRVRGEIVLLISGKKETPVSGDDLSDSAIHKLVIAYQTEHTPPSKRRFKRSQNSSTYKNVKCTR